MKRQFVVTHTVPKSDISALLGSWVTNTRSLKMLYPQKNSLFLYFRKNITYEFICYGSVKFFVSCQIVYLWVTKNCWFLSDTYIRLEV